jgi:hypothetical protein
VKYQVEADMGDALQDIRWTDDCQGKKDFDGDIVLLSTRYWPRGGGYSAMDSTGNWQHNKDRPHIRPSARSAITVLGVEVAFFEVEADTEGMVKERVEAWARIQIERIRDAVVEALK